MDPLRIPKDGFFAHKAMWDGWVDTEKEHTYIIGHWNYTSKVIKPVYVVSSGDKVELFVMVNQRASANRIIVFYLRLILSSGRKE